MKKQHRKETEGDTHIERESRKERASGRQTFYPLLQSPDPVTGLG